MKLSICVVTMNRANQLSEALQSCLVCELPRETEFVIIDNASTDHTEQVVKEMLDNSGYNYYYEKMPKNLGCGGGRNYAYSRSQGEIVYVLDDDAVIDIEKCRDFFARAIQIFSDHPSVVTLTSQIYDTAWHKNRVEANGSAIDDGLYRQFMFCGGSHFLRKSFYTESPYLPNKYGYEELPPSLIAVDKGKINAFCPDLLIIHKPAVDKWNWDDEKNIWLLINYVALPYAIKKMMYPQVAHPMIKLFYHMRKRKHLKKAKDRHKADEVVKEVINSYKLEYRIRFKTFGKLVWCFRKTIL